MYRHWQQLAKYDAPLLTMKPNKIIPTPMRNGCEGDEADIGNVCQSIARRIWFSPATIRTATRTSQSHPGVFSSRNAGGQSQEDIVG
jgi:hypothetical protein